MKEIQDKALLTHYLQQFHIESFFDTPGLPFHVYEYETGEFLNTIHSPKDYLKFIVEGSFKIYEICSDGSYYFLAENRNHFEVLGDLEFCGYQEDNHFQEVLERIRTVELPLLNIRECLWQDNRFLQHLIRYICKKVTVTDHFHASLRNGSLEDVLLYYMRADCPDHRITSVEDTAFRLSYSRSQLQRILRKLTAQGILEKEGRGTYRLV